MCRHRSCAGCEGGAQKLTVRRMPMLSMLSTKKWAVGIQCMWVWCAAVRCTPILRVISCVSVRHGTTLSLCFARVGHPAVGSNECRPLTRHTVPHRTNRRTPTDGRRVATRRQRCNLLHADTTAAWTSLLPQRSLAHRPLFTVRVQLRRFRYRYWQQGGRGREGWQEPPPTATGAGTAAATATITISLLY